MTEQSEHEALEALFADLHGTKDSIPLHRYTIKWRDRRDRFTTMLDAGAYLDAALTLVPAGYNWSLDNIGGCCGAALNRGPSSRHAIVVDAKPTPALALCAAIEATIARAGE